MEAYLDNSATTRCSRGAAELMAKILCEDYGNPSSLHRKGLEAERYVSEARKKIAKTLRVKEKELLFTSGGTESNNLAIFGAAGANQRAGRHIITTEIEHPSVYAAMKELASRGFELTILPVDRLGRISVGQLKDSLRPDTILVSIMHVNNEIGTVEPVEEAAEIVKSVCPVALYHVDAVQSYGKIPVYPSRAKIDLLSVSGHKLHGPKGSGFLYVREKTKLWPLLFGGGQERGLRSGTENVPAIAGLGFAAEEVYSGLSEKMERLFGWKEFFIHELYQIEGVTVNGVGGKLAGLGTADDVWMPEETSMAIRPSEGTSVINRSAEGISAAIRPSEGTSTANRPAEGISEAIRQTAPHIVSVSVEGVRAEVLLHALEDRGIYVSAGSACSSNRPSVSRTLKGIGLRETLLDSTIRFSFSTETSKEELEYALDALRELIPMLRRYRRQ